MTTLPHPFRIAVPRRQFIATAAFAAAASVLGAESAPLSVAVIGHTGRGGYGHGLDTMWLQLPETTVVAVADADPEGLAAAQAKLKIGKGYADYRRMLAEVRPSIVAVGPRHVDQHRDMVLAAVEAGARGIYMEKPFCRTPAEADEIGAACAARGVRLAVAHRNRYHPVLPVLVEMISGGAIGRVLEMRARGKEDQRGGALDLWVLGSHLCDLATVFGGRALTCSATVLQDGRPITQADLHEGDEGVGPLAGNEVHARYAMERGMPFFFDSVAKAGVAAAGFGLQLIGTEGVIDLRVDREPVAHLLAGSPFQPVAAPRAWVPITTGGVGKPEPVANLGKDRAGHLVAGRDLVAAVREGREPLCGPAQGAATVEMICAAFESHRRGGAGVELPLADRGNPLARL